MKIIDNLKHRKDDVERIGKFLKDHPTFISKQVGLQMSNPVLEGLENNKLNLHKIGNFINKNINIKQDFNLGENRIYNLGLNTLTSVATSGTGINVVRHGYAPFLSTYDYKEHILSLERDENKTTRLLSILKDLKENPKNDILFEYLGGPKSLFGIGKTTIRKYEPLNKSNLIESYKLTKGEDFNKGKEKYKNFQVNHKSIKEFIKVYKPSRQFEKITHINGKGKNIDRNNSLIKLSFRILNPFKEDESNLLIFQSYITSYGENNSSQWEGTKYIGRSDTLYNFNGFERSSSLQVLVPSLTELEVEERHRMVSQLASSLAGTYNYEGNLGGNIVIMNLGNYLVEEPVIITSLNWKGIDGSPWDIDKKIMHHLQMDINFKIIGKKLQTYYEQGGWFNNSEIKGLDENKKQENKYDIIFNKFW